MSLDVAKKIVGCKYNNDNGHINVDQMPAKDMDALLRKPSPGDFFAKLNEKRRKKKLPMYDWYTLYNVARKVIAIDRTLYEDTKLDKEMDDFLNGVKDPSSRVIVNKHNKIVDEDKVRKIKLRNAYLQKEDQKKKKRIMEKKEATSKQSRRDLERFKRTSHHDFFYDSAINENDFDKMMNRAAAIKNRDIRKALEKKKPHPRKVKKIEKNAEEKKTMPEDKVQYRARRVLHKQQKKDRKAQKKLDKQNVVAQSLFSFQDDEYDGDDAMSEDSDLTPESFIDCIRKALYRFKLHESHGYITKLMLSFGFFVAQLYKAQTYSDRLLALGSFLSGAVEPVYYARIFSALRNSVLTLTCKDKHVMNDEPIIAQSLAGKYLAFSSFVVATINCSFLRSIRSVILSFLSTKLFEKDIAKNLELYIGKIPKFNLLDFTISVVEGIGKIVEVADRWIQGEPFTRVLLDDNPAVAFGNEAHRLLSLQEMYYTGLPVEHKVEITTYLQEIDACVESGEIIMKQTRWRYTQTGHLQHTLASLKSLRTKVFQEIEGLSRRPPIGVVFHGYGGVGKSLFINLSTKIFCKVKGLDFNPGIRYSRVKTSQYFEGLDPLSHKVIFYSEMGAMHSRIAKNQGDPLMTEMNSIMDGIPMKLDMAFGGKGSTPCLFDMVLADTNTKFMHDKETLSYYPAARRRWIYVHLEVKEEYQMSGTTQLDKDKSLHAGGNHMDRYYITVERYYCNANQAVSKVLLNRGNINDFTVLLYKIIKEHIEIQDTVNATVSFDFVDKLVDDIQPIEFDLEDGKTNPDDLQGDLIEVPEDTFFDPEALLRDVDGKNAPIAQGKPNPFKNLFRRASDVESSVSSTENSSSDEILGFPEDNLSDDEVKRPISEEPIKKRTTVWASAAKVLDDFVEKQKRIHKKSPDQFHNGELCISDEELLVGRVPQEDSRFSSGVNGCKMYAHAVLLWLKYASWSILSAGVERAYKWTFMPKLLAFLAPIAFSIGSGFFLFLFTLLISLVPLYATPDNARRFVVTYFRYNVKSAKVKYHRFWGEKRKSEKVLLVSSALAMVAASLIAFRFLVRRVLKTTSVDKAQAKQIDPVSEIDRLMTDKMGAGLTFKRVNPKFGAWANTVAGKSPVFTGDAHSLSVLALRNVRQVRTLKDGNCVQQTHMLGLKSSFWIINTHAMNDADSIQIDRTRFGFDGSNAFSIYKLCDIQYKDIGNDRTILYLPGLQCRNVLIHCVDDFPSAAPGYVGETPTKVLLNRKNELRILDQVTDSKFSLSPFLHYDYPDNRSGQCGIPIVVGVNGGAFLVGIHTGAQADDKLSYATCLRFTDLRDAIDSFNKSFVPCSQAKILDDLSMPIVRSPFMFNSYEHIELIGKLPGPVLAKQKSRLVRTGLQDELKVMFDEFDLGPIEDKGRPLMQGRTRDGIYQNPYNICLDKMNAPNPGLNDRLLNKCVIEYVVHVLSGLRKRGITEIAPLSLEHAINGVLEDDFTRRMNVQTSAGYGYIGTKEKYLPLVDEGKCIRALREDVAVDVLNHIYHHLDGEAIGVKFKAALKDEPLAREKCDSGATRVFWVAPISYLVESRLVLTPLMSLIAQHGDLFGCAIGIDAHREFTNLVSELNSVSEQWMEGDYSRFDLTMPYQIGEAAATVEFLLCKKLGYSDHALTLLQGVLTECLYPHMVMCQDLFVKPGVQISGKYGTAEDNSIRDCLMLMYAYYSLAPKGAPCFFDKVVPRTYGDDILAAVHSDVQHFFNNITYKSVVENVYKMKFTTATKSGEMQKFLRVEDASFLKRRFKFRDGIWIGPLDPSSLFKTITWMLPSNAVSKDDQMSGMVQSMLSELYFHLDESRFTIFRERLLSLVAKHGYDIGNQPTFTQITARLRGDPDVAIEFEEKFDSGVIFSQSKCVRRRETYLGYKVTAEPLKELCSPERLDLSPYILSVIYVVAEDEKKNEFIGDSLIAWRNHLMLEIADLEVKIRDSGKPYTLFSYKRSMQLRMHPYIRRTDKIHIQQLQRLNNLKATLDMVNDLLSLQKIEPFVDIIAQSRVMNDGIPIVEDEKTENVRELDANIGKMDIAGSMKTPSDFAITDGYVFDKSFERPYEMLNGTIAVGSYLSASIPIWDALSLVAQNRARFRNYSRFRANIEVTVQLSGSPFHTGKIMIAYYPYPGSNPNLQALLGHVSTFTSDRPLLMTYLSQSKWSMVLDVSDNQPVTVTVPFISHKPFFRLHNRDTVALGATSSFQDFEYAGDFYLYSINPVGAVTAAPSDVAFRVHARFVDVEMGGITGYKMVVAQSRILDGADEKVSGPLERTASKLALVSRELSSVPGLGPYASVSEMCFNKLRDISAILGWSKPLVLEDPKFVKNRPFGSSALTIGVDAIEKLALDPKQELVIGSDVVAESIDEMTIQYIASKLSYLETFTWLATDAVYTKIWNCPVIPRLNQIGANLTDTIIQPTAMSFAVTPFNFWHGTIMFRFEFVCSAFHRGKVGIYFEPVNEQRLLIDADIELNEQAFQIVDLEQTQCVDICVPWMAANFWRPTTPQSSDTIFYPGNSVDPGQIYCNGYIAVIPITALQTPDDSNLSVNVYVCSPDLRVNGFGVALPTSKNVVAQSHFLGADDDVPCYQLGDKIGGERYGSQYSFGEEPLSFRSLLKRYVTTRTTSLAGPAASNAENLQYDSMRWPSLTPTYGGGTSSRFVDLLSYLRYSYLAMRGGFRKRIRIRSDAKLDFPTLSTVVSNKPVFYTPGYALVFTTAAAECVNRGSIPFIPDTQGGIEFELPDYNPNLYGIATNDYLVHVDNVADDAVTNWHKGFIVLSELLGAACSTVVVNEDTATAEDFTLMCFLGASLHTVPL